MHKATFNGNQIEEINHITFTFVENNVSNSPKLMGASFLGNHRLFYFASISKFRCRRVVLPIQMKERTSMSY